MAQGHCEDDNCLTTSAEDAESVVSMDMSTNDDSNDDTSDNRIDIITDVYSETEGQSLQPAIGNQ